jgi:hypothetical protein
MQRTVNSTKFTYVQNTIENGEIKSELKEVLVRETDEKKALRKAYKEVGNFVPIKVEQVSELYVLEDDIFFKYAHKVEG